MKNFRMACFFCSLLLILLLNFGYAQAQTPELKYQNIGLFGPEYPKSFADLIQHVQPAVVNISTSKTVKVSNAFNQYMRRHGVQKKKRHSSLGSGFIIDKRGYIVTNYHVVKAADQILVNLSDGRQFRARVVGSDQKTDLAVIQIKSPQDLPVTILGDSGQAQVGDWVLAIGNPFGLGHTVTKGIISAKGRQIGAGPYDNFIQTDASINPGNSGGPLFNMKGEVVAVNAAVVQSGQGIGFAIPINLVKDLLPSLIKGGRVVRGYLGVNIQNVPINISETIALKRGQGALIANVVPKSPAQKAGLKPGDIVVTYDGKMIEQSSDLPRWVARTEVNRVVIIEVIRIKERLKLQVKIGDLSKLGGVS